MMQTDTAWLPLDFCCCPLVYYAGFCGRSNAFLATEKAEYICLLEKREA